jgi:MFS family permease
MFGAFAYMPTYLQMVSGAGATRAGLLMTPMWAGMLAASTLSGQAVSRTGRYKRFPLIGTICVGAALALLSTMTPDTPIAATCAYLALMGVGLGMSSQILVLVVQNAFPSRQVGTATAATTYFRQIGASLGSAIVGTVFAARLSDLLASAASPATSRRTVNAKALTPETVQRLPAPAHALVVNAYNHALTPVFLYLAPLLGVAVVLLVLITEKPLPTPNDPAPLEPTPLAMADAALD